MLKGNSIGINTKTSSSSVLEAIPSYRKFFATFIPISLACLSLVSNNLSTESFPVDFSRLSMLKDLYLDDNPIVSLPNCVKSLPRLERLDMRNCISLSSLEHLQYTTRELIIYFDYKPFPRKTIFDLEKSTPDFTIDWESLEPSSFEFEGVIKIQPMAGVAERVLRSLGWTNLDFLNGRQVRTNFYFRGSEESQIQMYYEFGIFSTIYGGKQMPNWIHCRSKGPLISFTIPSSPYNFRGLNFCYVQGYLFPNQFVDLPIIKVSNLTKNGTWIYRHYIDGASVGGQARSLTLLSHWMFGINEMEAGDHVTITVTEPYNQLTKECGGEFNV
ncbi:uncharacterized protein LOC111899437 [Lactuca sativa]|uniref:uncharacterized protein LOC111899437 n=1 Tax=Lactuca sativa TaxID=4236 RepID=UPI000CD7F2D4|nr:uncharacterized protein LOC111899437 [Lactuca sativa]XP_042758014.1 uncharacterized protein LOC111899437 [Lactuca sativa]XP_042758016.1 uncharacterized protein LOC111899437 [Lactuca sativa]